MERRASATYNISQANWVVFVQFWINVRKNSHFWSCFISHSFVGICDIYLENSLLIFHFGFEIEKNDTRLSLQKIVSHIICCEKLIFYLNWNHQQICEECSLRHRILIYFTGNFFQCGISSYNQIMSSQHNYTTELPGHLFCFLLMLRRQCNRV